jgi:F-type H+-transporting ATPase subunit b
MHFVTKYSIALGIFFILMLNSAYAKEGMPQFNVNSFPSQLFWLVISFASLYVFIALLVLPRIRENITLRKNKISNDLERATAIKDQTEKILAEYEQKIEEAKINAKEKIRITISKANDDFNNQLSSAKKKLEKKVASYEIELLDYKKKTGKNITESALNISTTIIGKVLGDEVNEKELKVLLSKNLTG